MVFEGHGHNGTTLMDWGLLHPVTRDLWKHFVAEYSKKIAGVNET